MYKGLPQGAVLSPTLYDLYTEDIMNHLEEGVEVLQFADDIIIFSRGTNLAAEKDKIIKSMRSIRSRLDSKDLDLQMEKTELIVFSDKSKKKIQPMDTYVIDGITKKVEEQVKFLGIWLDSELNFRKQIEAVRAKVSKANNFLRMMMGVKWGVDCDTAVLLYKNLVRSTIDYGLFVFFPWEAKTRLLLERAQFAGLWIALSYRMSTPTNVIIAEAKVLTMENRAGLLARRFVGRTIAYGEANLKRIIEDLANTEERFRYGFRKRAKSLLTEAWLSLKLYSNIVRCEMNYCTLDTDYWICTKELLTDISIGEKRQKKTN